MTPTTKCIMEIHPLNTWHGPYGPYQNNNYADININTSSRPTYFRLIYCINGVKQEVIIPIMNVKALHVDTQ